jgi:dTMP kinase
MSGFEMSGSGLRGQLVVFEGVEGAGKSTQLQSLRHWLEQSGWQSWLQQRVGTAVPPIVVTREPGGTELGQQLRRLLLDSSLTEGEGLWDRTELLLYAADRAQHVQKVLKPAIAQGALVLCDRFTDSTIAYQGYGRGFDLDLIRQLNAIATMGLESDLTLWLDLEVQQGLQRAQARAQADQPEGLKGKDRMEAADLSFHQRVQQGFRAIAQDEPHRMVRIEASLSEVQVAEQIQAVMEKYLQKWYPQRLNP